MDQDGLFDETRNCDYSHSSGGVSRERFVTHYHAFIRECVRQRELEVGGVLNVYLFVYVFVYWLFTCCIAWGEAKARGESLGMRLRQEYTIQQLHVEVHVFFYRWTAMLTRF